MYNTRFNSLESEVMSPPPIFNYVEMPDGTFTQVEVTVNPNDDLDPEAFGLHSQLISGVNLQNAPLSAASNIEMRDNIDSLNISSNE